ncbi:MAG TPA: CARDB domain-containing protein [Candidatus Paceibacterota bacterium]|nr:CARDB domain-containing protein [Candidatus Paceibacterota bacterium]
MADAPETLPTAPESRTMNVVSNTLAIIGFIILAIIIVWGALHLISLSRSSLSSLFASPAPTISVTAPQSALSGQPVHISWKNSSSVSGSYAILYGCVAGFSFGTPSMNGAMNTVPCGKAIGVGSSTAATMMPVLSSKTPLSVPVTVIFTPSAAGSAQSEGSVSISVMPSGVAQTTQPAVTPKPVTKPAPKPTYSSGSTSGSSNLVAHAASGPADLSVTIIAVGYIDPSSGALLTNRAPNAYDTTAVEFDIANIGGSTSGNYSFQAHLPTVSGYTYTSPLQVSLRPGAHVVSTLRFTGLSAGGGMITVIADPNGAVNDSNRSNNEAAQNVQ